MLVRGIAWLPSLPGSSESYQDIFMEVMLRFFDFLPAICSQHVPNFFPDMLHRRRFLELRFADAQHQSESDMLPLSTSGVDS